MGISPIGMSGFGNMVVYGFSLVPLPPANMTAFMASFLAFYSAR